MKKLLALVLAGVMAFSLVACGGGNDGGDDAGEEKVKVGLIVTNLGDKSFNDSADRGLTEAKEAGLIDYTCIQYGNDDGKIPDELREAAETYDIVTCNNLGFGRATAWLSENAANYPDTTFVIFDEPNASTIERFKDVQNVQFLAYKANEADFLAGALAAKLSATGKIGFVGGVTDPVIQDFLIGYIEGAKFVNPDIKVNVSYIGNYQDTGRAKDLAVAAINDGYDVIHAVAGSAGNGALEAVKDAVATGKTAYGIGVDSDQYAVFKEANPDLAKTIVTSSLKEVGNSLKTFLNDYLAGTYTKSDVIWYGMDGGYCGIAKNENYEAVVSEAIRAEMTDIEAKMASGEIVVSSFYTMDTADFEAAVEDVK